jgi:hypothetical protein
LNHSREEEEQDLNKQNDSFGGLRKGRKMKSRSKWKKRIKRINVIKKEPSNFLEFAMERESETNKIFSDQTKTEFFNSYICSNLNEKNEFISFEEFCEIEFDEGYPEIISDFLYFMINYKIPFKDKDLYYDYIHSQVHDRFVDIQIRNYPEDLLLNTKHITLDSQYTK